MLLSFASLILVGIQFVQGTSRTSPPAGAVVVRAGTTTEGEFVNVATAMNALPNDNSAQTVFIFPGTYQGQVNISRTGPTKVNPPHHLRVEMII